MPEEEDLKVDWNLEEFDFALNGPIILKYEYEYDLFESDASPYVDFKPASLSQKDVKLEELSSLTNSVQFLAPPVEEIKPENSEPCAAALAIAANIPTPKPVVLSKWRNFISSAYYHPNILAHSDVECLKELFQLLGSDINFKSENVLIDLAEKEKDCKPGFHLRPMLPSFQKAPIFAFAQVKDFVIETELKVCIIKKYSIMSSMQNAVSEMVNFIIEYPEALYLETYGFILDFLLKFGIRSGVIIDAVMRTQRRRRRCHKPASVLILKQARRLGKGRKEFLEKILLRSPKRKYDPVVPIIVEPIPVRQLRNRRTGNNQSDGTPLEIQEPVSQSKSDVTQRVASNSVSEERFSTSRVSRAKRKLFSESLYKTNPGNLSNGLNGLVTAKRTVVPYINTQAKYKVKKFYSRRDKSLIETPYTCTLCQGRSFAYKGNLVIHMKKHHPSDGTTVSSSTKRKRREDGYRCKTHMQHFHSECQDWEPICNLSVSSSSVSKRKTLLENKESPVQENATKCNGIAWETTADPSADASKRIPENDSYFVHPAQDLDIEVENRINVSFEEMPFSTFNRVTTRQHFRTAVV